MREIDYRAVPDAPAREILALGGLRLQATCGSGGTLSVSATTDTNGASIFSSVVDTDASTTTNGGDSEDGEFNVGDTFTLNTVSNFDAENHQLTYTPSSGGAVTVAAAADRSSATGSTYCRFSGTAVG